MRGTSAILLGVTMVAALAAASRPVSNTSDAGEKYFACSPGYEFQTKNSAAVRCFKAGTTVTANIVCLPNTVKTLDFTGKKDVCMHTNNQIAVYGCPSGYNPAVRAGPDVCQKENDPSIVAPSHQVSL